MVDTRLRFADLKARRIVNNWPTLRNRIKNNGFPPGKLTGPNERTWAEGEIAAWIESRPSDAKPVPKSPGRPRKS